ncbi:hypothetical protein H0H93_004461 [Arthromyces matolae]|nr:hypothetical protein H0H93_004461 [Arthromyces matolae]
MNWALFGIVGLQIYIYFRNNFKDPLWLRVLVISTIGLDVVQTILATLMAWHILVSGYGNPNFIVDLPKAVFALPVLGGVG